MTSIAPLPGSSYEAGTTRSDGQATQAGRLTAGDLVLTSAGKLDELLKPIDVAALPEDRFQAYMQAEKDRLEANQQYLEWLHTNIPETVSAPPSPRTKAYANIVVGGRVVATIDNQGVVGTKNGAIGDRINKLIMDGLDAEAALPGGPTTAQDRAERIAKLVGGKIVKADTALTQRAFDALPPPVPSWTIDYDRMKSDPLYSQLQSCRAAYEAIKERRAAYTSASRDSVA